MITTGGNMHIKRYFAGMETAVVQSISLGIGEKAEAVSDFKLQCEIARVDVLLTSFDFINNHVIYKAEIPEEFVGRVYEVGAHSEPTESVSSESDSKIITTFDSDTEEWINLATGVESAFSTNSRVGVDALRLNPAASATMTSYMNQLDLDLSNYSGNDKFVFAYNTVNAFVSSVRFIFLTDTSNYFTIALGAQSAGYSIVEVSKSAATVTGTPDWSNINEIRVSATATSGGTADITFDAIRIEDVDTFASDDVMVSRKKLATFANKEVGKAQEIEFRLPINIS